MDKDRQRHTVDARHRYDSLADIYDRRWQSYIDASLERFLSSMSLRGDEEILDVACGTGELERRLIHRWPHVNITAVDLSPKMLARAKLKGLTGNVRWLEADSSSLPLPERHFDLVLCANSFHYFPRPMASLSEIRRCITPSGRSCCWIGVTTTGCARFASIG